jgi:hypothetical protein
VNYDLFISNDPGVTGGITILYKNGKIEVHKMPVRAIVVNKKNKKVYDIDEMFDLLSRFRDKKVLYIQEKVSSRPGEGSVSAFSFGKSSGLTIGLAVGLGFQVVEVSPVTWKKHFPQLFTAEIANKKIEIKELRLLSKTIKDKSAKKENKLSIDRLNRKIKSEAKTAARELASSLYPKLADNFVKKNTDGMAESVLIALYGRDNKNELV